MEYQIKDVAKILNVSTELIRYYEKQGIIHPERNSINNYRVYSIMDIFTLLEVMSCKNLGFSVKEVVDLKNTEFSQYFKSHADKLEQELKKEIILKEALCQRVRELGDRIEMWDYNKNNFWVQKSREKYAFMMVHSVGDHYGEWEISDSTREMFLAPSFMSFCESIVDFNLDTGKNDWWVTIERKYTDAVGVNCENNCYLMESGLDLCTSSEMGDIGSFSEAAVMPAINYANANGYEINGKPYAILLGRGKCNGKYKRMLEVHIPVKKH